MDFYYRATNLRMGHTKVHRLQYPNKSTFLRQLRDWNIAYRYEIVCEEVPPTCMEKLFPKYKQTIYPRDGWDWPKGK